MYFYKLIINLSSIFIVFLSTYSYLCICMN